MSVPRLIVGARVSTEDQAKEGVSLSHQLERGYEKVADLGGRVVGECVEAGISGSLYEARTDLQRALAQIEAGEADGMVWLDLSRLSRDIVHIEVIQRRIKRVGGQLHFCTAEYADTANGFLQRGISGVVNQYQRLNIKELSYENRLKAVAMGRQTQRSIPPLGYRIVQRSDVAAKTHTRDDLGHYEIVEEEARIVRVIFERYAAGDSLRAVCRHLHALGVATPKGRRSSVQHTEEGREIQGSRGGTWAPASVRVILTNTAYYGMASFGKTKLVKDDTRLTQGYKRDSHQVKVPPENWKFIPCPPIVSRELWEACNQRLEPARKIGAGRPDRKHVLTGLLRCPYCHRSMGGKRQFWRASDRTDWYTRYSCPSGSKADALPGDAVCWSKTFRSDQIEPQVIEVFLKIVQQPETLQAALEDHASGIRKQFSEKEYLRLKRELDQVDKTMKAAVQAQIAASMKGIDAEAYESILQETSGQRIALREAIDQLESQRRRFQRKDKSVESRSAYIAQAAGDVALTLNSDLVSAPEKHDVLSRLIDSIYPTESGGLRIVFRLGVFEPLQRWVWLDGAWEIIDVEEKAV